MPYVSEFDEDKLEAENRTRTWARIVPPCTILASGFVCTSTKPAYLRPFSAVLGGTFKHSSRIMRHGCRKSCM